MTSPPPPTEGGQLPLDFSGPGDPQDALVRTPALETTLAALSRWRDWPGGQMAVVGERRSGKTRLARDWAMRAGAWIVSGPDLANATISQIHDRARMGVAVDDADQIPAGENLLATFNLCREAGTPLLLTGANEPALWPLEPRDLRSRLGATPAVSIGPPDDVTLDLLLADACKQRFMKLPPETSRYIVKRLDARYDAIEPVAEALAAAAAGKALSRVVARKALDALENSGEEDDADALK